MKPGLGISRRGLGGSGFTIAGAGLTFGDVEVLGGVCRHKETPTSLYDSPLLLCVCVFRVRSRDT